VTDDLDEELDHLRILLSQGSLALDRQHARLTAVPGMDGVPDVLLGTWRKWKALCVELWGHTPDWALVLLVNIVFPNDIIDERTKNTIGAYAGLIKYAEEHPDGGT